MNMMHGIVTKDQTPHPALAVEKQCKEYDSDNEDDDDNDENDFYDYDNDTEKNDVHHHDNDGNCWRG